MRSAYSGYLIFFHEEVARLGPVGVLEEYVFSPHAVGPNFSELNPADFRTTNQEEMPLVDICSTGLLRVYFIHSSKLALVLNSEIKLC